MKWIIGIPALVLLTFVAEIAAEIVAEGFLEYLEEKDGTPNEWRVGY